MKTKLFIILVLDVLFFLSAITLNGQVVVSTPAFPTAEDEVVIQFNAQEGSGGLAGYTGDVYAHTGVITENSNSSSDWKYVKTDWGQNTPDTKLTRVGTDLYELIITPDVINYYGVPAGERIDQISLVFRSDVAVGGGYLEGKTASGGDIFVDISQSDALDVRWESPSNSNSIVSPGEQINLEVSASKSAKIVLYENGSPIDSVINSTSFNYTATILSDSRYKVIATSGSETQELDLAIILQAQTPVQDLPGELNLGFSKINDNTARLTLEAPNKESILIHNNLSDWYFDSNYWMNKTSDGRYFWKDIDVSNLNEEGFQYQYIIDDIVIADPLSELILDRAQDGFLTDNEDIIPFPSRALGQHVTVIKDYSYDWQAEDYERPDGDGIVIYEILMRDFLGSRNYEDLKDSISYLKKLGVNAIQLMPIQEFEGNLSWGYNPSFHGAVDKYYGTPQELKAVIDECHKNGIAVILDVVFNHVFSQSPLAQLYWDGANFRPTDDNPWLNIEAKHPFNVGYDVNHEYEGTQDWMDAVLKRWVEEYRFDGFRFDLSKGFTQTDYGSNVGAWGGYDAGRITLLKRMADQLWSVDPDSYVILEHFAENREEKELAEYGMYVWGNMNHNYSEAAMGFVEGTNSNLSGAVAEFRTWSDNHLISYMESHDEERMMYRLLNFGNENGSYSTKDFNTAIDRAALAATFFYPLPGPKMLWQFGELGFDYSINRCEDGTIQNDCRLSPKPVFWNSLRNGKRASLADVHMDLIYLKEQVGLNPDLWARISRAEKAYSITGADLSAVAVGNFDLTNKEVIVEFPSTGTWYGYFSDEEIEITEAEQTYTLAAGEYRVYTNQKLDRPSSTNPILGIEDELQTNLQWSVYPNPVNRSSFTIVLDPSIQELIGYELIDATGKRISAHEVDSQSSINRINLESAITNGFYYIKIYTDQGIAVKGVIINR